MQVCSDGESLCSSQSECSVCGSDGSAVLFTATDPQRTYEYLEVGAPHGRRLLGTALAGLLRSDADGSRCSR